MTGINTNANDTCRKASSTIAPLTGYFLTRLHLSISQPVFLSDTLGPKVIFTLQQASLQPIRFRVSGLALQPLVSNNHHFTRTIGRCNRRTVVFFSRLKLVHHPTSTVHPITKSTFCRRFVNFESHQFCKTFLDALHKPSNRKKLLT